MQNLIKLNPQHVTSFVVTFAAVLVGLPVANAVLPSNQPVAAHSTPTVSVSPSGLGSCTTTDAGGSGQTAGQATTAAHHNAPATVNTSTNNGGATAQVGNAVVGVSTAVNDVADVTVGDVLSNNDISVLSGNSIANNLLNNNQVLNNTHVLSDNNTTANVDVLPVLGGLLQL